MKVISNHSRILNPREEKLSTLDRELLGIVHGLQFYDFLVIGSPHPIHVFTCLYLHVFTIINIFYIVLQKKDVLDHAFTELQCN